jgi:hypothetical protein
MYTIINIEKGWIVCHGQSELIRFSRKSVAVRTAHNAEKLMRKNDAEKHKTKPISAGKLALAY